jgi:hypothetical protein
MSDLYFDETTIEKVCSISKDIYSTIRINYDSTNPLPNINPQHKIKPINYCFTTIVDIDKIKITSNNTFLNENYKLGFSFNKVRFNKNDDSSYYL